MQKLQGGLNDSNLPEMPSIRTFYYQILNITNDIDVGLVLYCSNTLS